jgi:hypothetical protein
LVQVFGLTIRPGIRISGLSELGIHLYNKSIMIVLVPFREQRTPLIEYTSSSKKPGRCHGTACR